MQASSDRATSDTFPVVLTLAAFVLMILGQSAYERMAEAWVVMALAPWLGADAATRFAGLSSAAGPAPHFCAGLKYLKSGSGWSFLTGIRKPSAFKK
jgi:hypothetical protein